MNDLKYESYLMMSGFDVHCFEYIELTKSLMNYAYTVYQGAIYNPVLLYHI